MNTILTTAYESIFILRPDLDEEAVAKACDRIGAVVTSNHGSVIAMEKMGHRHLSYEVKGHNEGYYVILNYEGQAGTGAELERTYRISDEVIRYLIVKRETPFKPALGRESVKETTSEETTKEPPETGSAEGPGEQGLDPAQVASHGAKEEAPGPSAVSPETTAKPASADSDPAPEA